MAKVDMTESMHRYDYHFLVVAENGVIDFRIVQVQAMYEVGGDLSFKTKEVDHFACEIAIKDTENVSGMAEFLTDMVSAIMEIVRKYKPLTVFDNRMGGVGALKPVIPIVQSVIDTFKVVLDTEGFSWTCTNLDIDIRFE